MLLINNLHAQEKMEDVVYLKNGSIIRGEIIEQIIGKSIKIQTKDGSSFVYKMSEITKMTKEPAVSKKPPVTIVKTQKSPGTAALLSVVIPGLGNIYAEKIGTGLLNMIAVSLGYAAYLSDPEEKYWNGVLALGLHIFDIYDAHDNAKKYNEKLMEDLSLSVIPLKKGIKFSIRMKF